MKPSSWEYQIPNYSSKSHYSSQIPDVSAMLLWLSTRPDPDVSPLLPAQLLYRLFSGTLGLNATRAIVPSGICIKATESKGGGNRRPLCNQWQSMMVKEQWSSQRQHCYQSCGLCSSGQSVVYTSCGSLEGRSSCWPKNIHDGVLSKALVSPVSWDTS